MDRLLIANWKHNPVRFADAIALARATAAIPPRDGVALVVCPPAPYLASIGAACPGLALGAQDVSAEPPGAHTGEVGTAILQGLGVSLAIVGHSERRAAGETDDQVAAKVRALLAAGMTPVVCVGEPRDVRAQGTDAVRTFLSAQLSRLPSAPALTIAYEPVWAIGHDTTDDPADAGETARWIAEHLAPRAPAVRVLYGGSVTPENAAALRVQDSLGGFLVGHESLDAGRLAGIVAA